MARKPTKKQLEQEAKDKALAFMNKEITPTDHILMTPGLAKELSAFPKPKKSGLTYKDFFYLLPKNGI